MNAHTNPAAFTAVSVTQKHLWLELTAAANQAFKEGAIDKAEALYRQGLAEAERLFATRDESEISVPLPVVMNIACHNLAQLAAQRGNDTECRQLLILAFDRLIEAARRPDTAISLRIACIQHLRYALAELAKHLEGKTAPEPPISHYLEQFQKTKAAVHHAVVHVERTKNWTRCGHCGLDSKSANRPARSKRAETIINRKDKL